MCWNVFTIHRTIDYRAILSPQYSLFSNKTIFTYCSQKSPLEEMVYLSPNIISLINRLKLITLLSQQ